MEKKDELREFAGICSKSLSDDVELHQEVEQELLDHLEEAFEEERRNGTDEEAFEKAVRRFGNPEEISRELVEGNAARLSRHARIRRAVKWLLLPMLIVGVILCIDVRGILASSLVLKFAFPKAFGAESFAEFNYKTRTKELTELEQLLFDYYRSDNGFEIAEKIYNADNGDAMHCAIYALELAVADKASPVIQAKLKAVLEDGRRIDGINPLYDYIEAYALMFSACDLSATSGENAIKDRALFAKAVEIYSRALQKGAVKTYSDELHEKVLGMLVTKRDMLGGMQLMDFESRERLPYLTVFMGIAKMLPLYCERLYTDGNDMPARELLGTWRGFMSQWQEGNRRHELDLMACFKSAKGFIVSARKIGATEEITALQAVLDFQKEWVGSIAKKDSRRVGGFLAIFVMPGTDADKSAFKIERKLEAATFDVASLSIACAIILLLVVTYGVRTIVERMRGRRPFLLMMPADSYGRMFLYGIVLPAVAYLLISVLAGGVGGISGWLWQLLSIAFLCICWPLYYAILCRAAISKRLRSIGAMGVEGFKASPPLNMLCLFVVLLLAIGGIMRPVQNYRQRCYARKESLIIPWRETENQQERSLKELHQRMAGLLK